MSVDCLANSIQSVVSMVLKPCSYLEFMAVVKCPELTSVHNTNVGGQVQCEDLEILKWRMQAKIIEPDDTLTNLWS